MYGLVRLSILSSALLVFVPPAYLTGFIRGVPTPYRVAFRLFH